MSYLALAKKIQAETRPSADTKSSAVDRIVEENVIAILIDSTVLGAPIWFAFRDGWRPDEPGSIPIFYASELLALREKTTEQLRSIFNVKRTFGGGMVRQ